MTIRLSALLLLLLSPAVEAASWKLRAREHFETGRLSLADGQGDLAYRGFLSAFNIWYEEPFDLSYGLTIQRGSLKRVSRHEKVTVTAIGLEGKHFPFKGRKWFWRGGLLSTMTDPDDSGGDFWLHGGELGTGWEFPLWRLGLAPEVGAKQLWGTRGKFMRNVYAAIGVHFYIFKGDKKPGDAAAAAAAEN